MELRGGDLKDPRIFIQHRLHMRRTLILILLSIQYSDSVYIEDEDGFGLDERINGQPRLVTGEWSICSSTCGNGLQSRSIECRVSHPLAGHLKLPIHECKNLPSPPLFRSCSIQSCALQEESNIIREEFHWKQSDWSPCSASCLGGKQRALLQCIQLSTARSVAWSQCDGRRRPPERTRSCNTQACPPEWITSEYSECNEECGSYQYRTVRCISRSTNTGGAITQLILNDNRCSEEKPKETQLCPQNNCHGWKVEEWSPCTVSCGKGEESRRVTCGIPSSCPLPSPPSIRSCIKESCPVEDREDNKKLTLGLGGIATLYQGSSIKVKCPRKKNEKKKMYWTKDGIKIMNTGNIKVSMNGNLRINHARLEDSGLYECHSHNGIRGNVTIKFKLRDNETLPLTGGKKMRKERAKYKGGPWGECIQPSCQFKGIQERNLQCFITEGHSHRPVSLSICETFNITRPPYSRPCSRTNCAHWNTSAWSSCSSSPCIHKWTSQQYRHVDCISEEGKTLSHSHCDLSTKPSTNTICANPLCIPEWKSSQWGQCSSSCGTGGVQLRILHCVWSYNGKPAGESCTGIQQPRTTRACSHTTPLPPCTPRIKDEEMSDCFDLSRFCDIIKLFHSCESEHVRQRCCSTCNTVEKNKLR